MENTHHAYVYWGTDVTAVPSAAQRPSVDCVHIIEPAWGIAHSRQLTAAAQTKPVAAPHRTLVAVASTLTIEAQNALLKLLEEPPAAVLIYLVVPGPDRLLPTVRSRLCTPDAPNTANTAKRDTAAWTEFAAQTPSERLAAIAALVKKKDTTGQHALIEAAIHDPTVPPLVRVLLDTHGRDRGASRKMLLEEVALARPQ